MLKPNMPDSKWMTVEKRITAYIESHGGCIPFRDFMELELYLQPSSTEEGGYYSGGKVKFGPSGDFFTGPDMHSPYYGQGLAQKLVDCWEQLGKPSPFTVVEMGCGSGVMAKDILDSVAEHRGEFAEALDFVLLEISPLLVKRQKRTLASVTVPYRHIIASAYQLPLADLTGVIISNELPDAFPFHRLINLDGRLGEVYIGIEDGEMYEEIKEVNDPELVNYVRDQYYQVVDGEEFCVSPAATRWMAETAHAMERGFVITIDYGYDDRAVIENKGSAARYYGQREVLGGFDITCDMDFPGLIRTGEENGLKLIELTDEVDYTAGFAHYELGMRGSNGRARFVMVQQKQ